MAPEQFNDGGYPVESTRAVAERDRHRGPSRALLPLARVGVLALTGSGSHVAERRACYVGRSARSLVSVRYSWQAARNGRKLLRPLLQETRMAKLKLRSIGGIAFDTTSGIPLILNGRAIR